MNIILRKAKPEDAAGIQEVFYLTWLDTYPNAEVGVTKEDIESKFEKSFSEDSISELAYKLGNLPATTLFLVAVDEDEAGKVVGLCRIFLLEDCNQLQAIYVLPSHQRQGIGLKLWEEARRHLQDEKKTVVHVATYNKQAISFYEKIGFADTGKRFEEEKFRMPVSGVVIPEMEMEL